MQTTWQYNNWFENNNSVHRQAIALFVSIVIVGLLLLIPIRKHFSMGIEEKTIEVELTKIKPLALPKIIVPEPVKEIAKIPKVDKVKPIQQKPKVEKMKVTPKVTIEKQVLKANKENAELPSSGVILNSAFNPKKIIVLDEDFKKSTANENDFKFKQVEQPQWNQVTKLIDEEVDKPRSQMNFYSEGIVGSTERFFDKITIKKRFTTRYGTKIDCVLIAGVIGACGWK